MANWPFNQLINKFIGLHWPCSALSGRSSRSWFCLEQNRPFQRLLRRWDLTRRTPSPGVARRSWNGAGKWSQSVWSAIHSGQRHPLIDPRPLSPWRIWSKGNYLIIVLITFVFISSPKRGRGVQAGVGFRGDVVQSGGLSGPTLPSSSTRFLLN